MGPQFCGVEQWGFFSVSHLLWDGTSVLWCRAVRVLKSVTPTVRWDLFCGVVRRNREIDTLIPAAERLSVELSLSVYNDVQCNKSRPGFWHSNFRMRCERSSPALCSAYLTISDQMSNKPQYKAFLGDLESSLFKQRFMFFAKGR